MTLRPPTVTPLPRWRDPLEVLELSRGMPRTALLLSGSRSGPLARYSLFAADPYLTLSWRDGVGRSTRRGRSEEERVADPFAWLRGRWEEVRCPADPSWPFPGGAIGFFSYDAVRSLEGIPDRAADDRSFPWIEFSFYSWAINWDHARRRWALLEAGEPGERGPSSARTARRAAWARAPVRLPGAARPATRARGPSSVPAVIEASLDRENYLAAVRAVKDRIAEGDCYEANIARRVSFVADVDPRRLFTALSRENPAPFAAYIECGSVTLVGSSPERFLRVDAGVAESRPIKGTAARVSEPDADAARARALQESVKDRAENVMIVDLVRNDLGRVCLPGSVTVRSLCGLESYAGVHHLVSTVTGRLAPGRDALDAVRALFPPGSMTGAPKISAMRLIETLEPVRRGPYAGAAGYLSASGVMDLSVVIRSFLISHAGVDLQVGGAVVADSDPEAEFEESEVKGARALAALAAAAANGPRP